MCLFELRTYARMYWETERITYKYQKMKVDLQEEMRRKRIESVSLYSTRTWKSFGEGRGRERIEAMKAKEEEEEQEEQSRGDTEGPGGAELQHQNSYRECK